MVKDFEKASMIFSLVLKELVGLPNFYLASADSRGFVDVYFKHNLIPSISAAKVVAFADMHDIDFYINGNKSCDDGELLVVRFHSRSSKD